MDRIDELRNIVWTNSKAKKMIKSINSSQNWDLEEDFGVICNAIKSLRNMFFNEFIQELIEQDRIELLINNVEKVGADNLLRASLDVKNDKLEDYIEKNLNNLVSSGYEQGYLFSGDIKKIILNHGNNKEVVSIAIRNMETKDRLSLIQYIKEENKELGSLDEYALDFLFINKEDQTKKFKDVLIVLKQEKDIDKIKLLKEISSNLEKLIQFYDEENKKELKSFFDVIKQIEDLAEEELQEKEPVEELNNKISDNFESIVCKYNYNVDLVNSLRQFNIDNSKFKSIQDNIINVADGIDIVKYIQAAKGNEGFEKSWDYLELTKQMFKNNENIMQDKIVQHTIAILLQELCEHENIGITDIEYGGSGFYNFNIKIGDYILKLGTRSNSQEHKSIPNHKRILKPIIRQQNNKEGKENIARIFLQVQNVVDSRWYKDLSEEEIKEQLYNIYSELRDSQIRWTDIKAENVGRLLKPNKENFAQQVINEKGELEIIPLKSDNYAITFSGEEPDEVLGPGELVIIDIDYLFKMEDLNFSVARESYYGEFEKRYKEENKKQKIKTKSVKNIIENEKYNIEDIGIIKSKLKKLEMKLFKGKNRGIEK